MFNDVGPLHQVIKSCEFVAHSSREVQIIDAAIDKFSSEIYQTSLDEMRNGVAWDALGWHYCLDVRETGARTCQYIFVLDSLNFCFWPVKGLQYEHLAKSLKNVETI